MGIARHNPLTRTEIAKKGKDVIPSPFFMGQNLVKNFDSTWSSPRLSSPPSSQASEPHPSRAHSVPREELVPQAQAAAVAAERVLLSYRTLQMSESKRKA
jgi:hypothetical protein